MSWFDDRVDDVKDAFSVGSSFKEFFNDPLGALEDWFNTTLDIATFGLFSYTKDKIRDYVAGLIPEQTFLLLAFTLT